MSSSSRYTPTVCCTLTIALLMAAHAAAAEPSLDQIIQDLQSGDPEAIAAAADAFAADPRQPEVVVPLLVRLLDEETKLEKPAFASGPAYLVADHAKWALMQFEADAMAPVIDLVESPNPKVRQRAAEILGNVGAPTQEIAAALAHAFESERDESIRVWQLHAYAKAESDPALLVRILLVAMDDESPDVASTAIQFSGERGLALHAVINRITAALEDQRQHWEGISNHVATVVLVRLDAAEALAEFGPRAARAGTRLREMMRSDEDMHVRIAAAYALYRVLGQDDEALDYLIETAEPSDKVLFRADVVEYLGKLGPGAERALPAVIECATFVTADDSMDFGALLRSEAYKAAAAIGGVDALPVLRRGLSAEDEFEREAAADAIRELGPAAAEAVPELIVALADDRELLAAAPREAAAKALGAIGPEAADAIPVLAKVAIDAYERDEEWLGDAAKDAIRRIRGEKEIEE